MGAAKMSNFYSAASQHRSKHKNAGDCKSANSFLLNTGGKEERGGEGGVVDL